MQWGASAEREAIQRAGLNRMRRIATGLLVAMALLFVVAHLFDDRYPALAYVAAFAEAAMVGALADWFAVTALFRHPLGLRIPHTAIIPANKERIGDNLGNFLEQNFISVEVVHAELARFDLAGAAANWLSKSENVQPVSRQLVASLPTALQLVDDKDATRFLRDALSGSLEGVKLAPMLSRILSVLVAGGQHTVLLERFLSLVATALDEQRPYIRQKVHEHSPKWVPRLIDEKFYERLMEGVQDTLDDIRSEDGAWRTRFEDATDELIEKLAHSEEYERKLQDLLARGLRHPVFRRYVSQVWGAIRERLLADAQSSDSRLAAHLDRAMLAFGRALWRSPAVQERLNETIRSFAAHAIVSRREVIVSLVRRVIHSWDAETISSKFELYVGRDLQYIRINGTIVGGLAGLLIHVVAKAL